MPDSLTAAQITLSHTIDDAAKIQGKARRAAKEIDRILPDLRHAIEHGQTAAAADLLTTIDRLNLTILDATAPSK